MTAPPTRLGHRSRAILHLMTAPLIASLPVHIQQHLMTAQITVHWTPLPLRYHLTTYTYKNTCLIINNNYLIIQNKTRPHTPSRSITSFFTARSTKPSYSRSIKLSHSRSTSQAYSRSTQLSHSTSTKPRAPNLLIARAPNLFTAEAPAKPATGALSFLTQQKGQWHNYYAKCFSLSPGQQLSEGVRQCRRFQRVLRCPLTPTLAFILAPSSLAYLHALDSI